MKRFKKKFATRKSFDRLDDQSQCEQEKKRPSDLERGGRYENNNNFMYVACSGNELADRQDLSKIVKPTS